MLEKRFEMSIFVLLDNSAQKHEGFVGLENACSRANTYVVPVSLNYTLLLVTSMFVTAKNTYNVKNKCRSSTARELND